MDYIKPEIDEQEEELKHIKERIEDAEIKIRSKQEEINTIAEAMKPSYAEIQEIESKVSFERNIHRQSFTMCDGCYAIRN